MVDLYVGPQKDRFHVHKEVLCKKIPYFEKMFKAGFKEATENQATFPEDNAESFDLLLGWVYHNSIRPLAVLRKDGTSNESFESWNPNKLSMLAEKLCLSDLQDQIMDEYIEYLVRENLYPSVAGIGATYTAVPAGNSFRKFGARFFHWAVSPPASSMLDLTHWSTDALAKLMQDQDDLAEDVLTLLRTGVKASNPIELPRCEFHCHGKDEPCPTKKGSKD
jgi:BTB/POZ domain